MNVRVNWILLVAFIGWLIWLLSPVLTPFVVSGLLAYLADPLVDRLDKLNLPRTISVVIVFIATFVGLGMLLLLLFPLIQAQILSFIEKLPEIILYAERVWLPNITGFLGADSGLNIGLSGFLSSYGDMAGDWIGMIIMSLSKSGSALAATVMSFFLVPILTFYLLRDWDQIFIWLGTLIPSDSKSIVLKLTKDTDSVLGAFMKGQTLVMVSLALIYSIGLTLVGLEFAIAIGVVAGLVSFIPYLGFIFGFLLASLTVLMESAPLMMFFGVSITFIIGQFIESSLLTPKLVGDRIGLHPVAVIFAIAAGGQLFGFFGILLALPLGAVISVLVRYTYNNCVLGEKDFSDSIVNSSIDKESDL